MTYEAAPALDALGEPTRREILERLRGGPKSVAEIAAGMPVSRPAVSQHLLVLKGAGLVSGRKDGTRRLYRVEPGGLEAVGKYLGELSDSAMSRSTMPLVNDEERTATWKPIPPAHDAAEVRRRHDANRASWNEAANWYEAQNAERIEELRAGKSNLHPVEREMLGDLVGWCETAIHLQCASGRDTLSLWIEGAKRVIGVDISDLHIENARKASEALGAPAEWYRCDVLDTPHSLDGTADLVYTGRGAINWIHDITAWARVVARLLKPGGVVSVFDNHAVIYFFDPDADDWKLIAADYFDYTDESQGWGEGYIGDELGIPTDEQAPKFERVWPPSAVFNALREAGLSIERFGEHSEEYFPAFPHVTEEKRRKIPLTFSMLARKPT